MKKLLLIDAYFKKKNYQNGKANLFVTKSNRVKVSKETITCTSKRISIHH